MAESLKIIRRRIRSIGNTRQITRAMEMVSAAKLRQAQRILMEARPYARHMQTLLGRMAPGAEATGNPWFLPKKSDLTTLVLFTADRGLCGSYNANIIRQAENLLKDRRLGAVELVCIGRRGGEYFRRRQWPIVAQYADFSSQLSRERSDEVTDFLCQRFLGGVTSEIYLLYNAFVSTSFYRPTHEKFLDMDQSVLMKGAPAEERVAIDYIFEPNRQRVFERLIPEYLYSKVFITLAEALTSEHSARMLAMNNATQNCQDLAEALTLRMNKARQGAITRDLIDIVGGAEALVK